MKIAKQIILILAILFTVLLLFGFMWWVVNPDTGTRFLYWAIPMLILWFIYTCPDLMD